MKHPSGALGKGRALHKHIWRCVLLAGLSLPWLALVVVCTALSARPVFAAPFSFSQNMFTSSPKQGPVGAVIVVSGKNVFYPDGTQVALGYTLDFRNCLPVAGGQTGLVQNHGFSGWFRWPATGTGNFGVCLSTSGSFSIQVGSYRVLSSSAPSVTVTPGTLDAGKQATVVGANFLPGRTSVNLVWSAAQGGQSISLGQVTANSAGTFSTTFTVPSHASTGTYTLTGTAGSGSPPTLSAVATFPVNGITIAAVPTPTVQPGPTTTVAPAATPKTKPATVTSHVTVSPAQANSNAASKTGLLLAIGLSGGFLIVLALGAGIVIVRRQRVLTARVAAGPGVPAWPDAPTVGAFPQWGGTVYPGGNAPVGDPGLAYSPSLGPAMPHEEQTRVETLPFDPGLAEAMREAQVSLFAMPRPSRGAEVESGSGRSFFT